MDTCSDNSDHKKINVANQPSPNSKCKISPCENSAENLQIYGQVSFTDFSEITSPQKPSDNNNVINLSVANGNQSTSQIANKSNVVDDVQYVTRHNLPQTLRPFGTNRRIHRLISLVNRKRKVVLQEPRLTRGTKPSNMPNDRLIKSKHEISALCRHLEKLKRVDPLYSVAIYKLKALMG